MSMSTNGLVAILLGNIATHDTKADADEVNHMTSGLRPAPCPDVLLAVVTWAQDKERCDVGDHILVS